MQRYGVRCSRSAGGLGPFASSSSTSCFSIPSKFSRNASSTTEKATPDLELDLNDTKTIYQTKTTEELIKASSILAMCQFNPVVEIGTKILNLSDSALWRTPAYWVMKHTFFPHFCSGESLEESREVINRFHKIGASVIPDYSVEEADKPILWEQNLNDRLKMLDSCATLLRGMVKFSPLKVTSLGSPSLLEKMTRAILHAQNNPSLNFRWLHGEKYVKVPAYQLIPSEKLEELTQTEENLFNDLMGRLHKICEKASATDQAVLVDAEQTHRQPGINHLCRLLAKQHNKTKPVVYNTYQMYLKGNYDIVNYEVELSKKENYIFGVKVVRGAYIFTETERAVQKGYSNPIQETKPKTDAEYNKAIALLLANLDTAAVVIATHNAESVLRALQEMKARGIAPNHPHVNFAQLMGISDHLTLGLANKGVNINKLLPYGPVDNVMPYLIRRVQENSSIFGGAQLERELMAKEIKRRLHSSS